ncbi:aldolase/citrate lyase family protein [Methylobacterium sp. 77]|uniref:aldolase/citrate lyase family protein n=1 Tax=Methylobacterium sp. 77 TaxID=1101192 RepID=UPI00036DF172|nr:aldolase/citrate lyase family protein [Methylobacterium sp. 77]
MRAILIVPGEARAVAAAMASGAQALIVDVTDLAPPGLPAKGQEGAPLLYLRSRDVERDLPAMMEAAPHGIVLTRCEGARDVMRLGARLAVEEAMRGIPDGATRILALIETAKGALALPTLVGSSDRLAGIAWDAEAARAEIAAPAIYGPDGGLIPPLAQIRSLVRLTAAAAGIDAIDTACPLGGPSGSHLAREIEAARRDGFAGKLVRDADQVRSVMTGDDRSPASLTDA